MAKNAVERRSIIRMSACGLIAALNVTNLQNASEEWLLDRRWASPGIGDGDPSCLARIEALQPGEVLQLHRDVNRCKPWGPTFTLKTTKDAYLGMFFGGTEYLHNLMQAGLTISARAVGKFRPAQHDFAVDLFFSRAPRILRA